MRKAVLLAITCLFLLAGCGGGHPVHSRTAQAVHCPGYVTVYGCQAHSRTFGVPPTGLQLPQPSLVPTVEMRDTVTVSAIPAGTLAVGGYISGSFNDFAQLVQAFPHAYHVSIATWAGAIGQCLDIEPGDAVPPQARGWFLFARAHGIKRPCFYANLSTMPAVKASLVGLPRSSYLLWVADWVFVPELLAGFDAQQWTDHGPHGENYDESTVSLAFLGINPKPLLPVCVHRRMTRAQCSALRTRAQGAQRAQAASQRASVARACPVLEQRVSWFSRELKAHPTVRAASRRRALAASRRASRRNACAVFDQRQRFFAGRAAQLGTLE